MGTVGQWKKKAVVLILFLFVKFSRKPSRPGNSVAITFFTEHLYYGLWRISRSGVWDSGTKRMAVVIL
jgi:hypothetical protein